MNLRRAAALSVLSVAYILLVTQTVQLLGANYEEVVPYVLTPLDLRDVAGNPQPYEIASFVVISPWLPRLSLEPGSDRRWPVLNQPYMTNHLSYGGVAMRATGLSPLMAARLWHALFGLLLLWCLYDLALLLGLGPRVGLMSVAIAATSLPFVFMYSWARFDESLPSFGAVVVLQAVLRFVRSGANIWLWLAVVVASLAISAKITSLWPLSGILMAALLAGWRPPSIRCLVRPTLAVLPLFLPILGFAVAGPSTVREVGRRLSFLTDFFTTDVIPATSLNFFQYLGSWSGILSEIVRGEGVRQNYLGIALIVCTFGWLVVRSASPGSRRQRIEFQMLIVALVVFAFVAMFYREHRDYQFVLLVPLHSLAVAAFLEWCAQRWLNRLLPAYGGALLLCALPVGANFWDQRGFSEDLSRAANALFDLHVQRASADWLMEHGELRPIVVTFYAVGTYEMLSGGKVRPVYVYPMFRRSKAGAPDPDLVEVWREILRGRDSTTSLTVLLPVGQNRIESRHFDEPGIARAMLIVADAERKMVFTNRNNEPVLEVWRIRPSVELGD